MFRYETCLLTIPEITADESKNLESQLDHIVNELKGTMLSYERWGKYQLSYPVRKNNYGMRFLVRFEVDKDNKNKIIDQIKNLLSVRQAELVMRYIIVRLDPKQSLEYLRPESLDEIPATVEPYFKEHKAKGSKELDEELHEKAADVSGEETV